jgi:hypothetical protein
MKHEFLVRVSQDIVGPLFAVTKICPELNETVWPKKYLVAPSMGIGDVKLPWKVVSHGYFL